MRRRCDTTCTAFHCPSFLLLPILPPQLPAILASPWVLLARRGDLRSVRAVHGRPRVGHRPVGVARHDLGLCGLQRGAERRVLDPELIDDRAALLPPPVRLVGGRERGVEQLRARFERLDVPAAGRGRDAGQDGEWDGRERKNSRC